MVDVMKIIMTFTRSQTCIVALSAPDPSACHCQLMPLPETPVHSWASLGLSLVGSVLLSPGFWWAQVSVCALQEPV